MKLEQNVSLKNFNTFNIDIKADNYIRIETQQDLLEALKFIQSLDQKTLILNGGSNILFTKNVSETVLHLYLKGIEKIDENDKEVFVEVQAGENWNDFVHYCLNNNWGGIENLTLIPGNVGTSPMQNIGAYGVEVKDVITEVKALNINDLSTRVFTNEDCHFGYRESYFKNEGKGKFIILSVQFRLQKAPHQVITDYGAIQAVLKEKNISQPTIQQVSKAVQEIREQKLPNPKKIGNAGSFFKNPVIAQQQFEALKKNHPEIPSYKVDSHCVKIPAGWLIENAGWKGKRFGNYGVYDKQALILVNYGGASGEEIYQLSENIIEDIKQKFGITLEREVNIYH